MIYVASSWQNILHVGVVAALKSAARMQGDQFLPYDFRNPSSNDTGFHWTDVGMPTYNLQKDYTVPTVPFDEYIKGISHPLAEKGFDNDFQAMQTCDTCVLVLPCGRSAHLELGWFVGQGRRTAILGEAEMTPELMYKMVDYIAPSLFDLLGWLGVKD